MIFAVLKRRLLQWRETEASFRFYNTYLLTYFVRIGPMNDSEWVAHEHTTVGKQNKLMTVTERARVSDHDYACYAGVSPDSFCTQTRGCIRQCYRRT